MRAAPKIFFNHSQIFLVVYPFLAVVFSVLTVHIQVQCSSGRQPEEHLVIAEKALSTIVSYWLIRAQCLLFQGDLAWSAWIIQWQGEMGDLVFCRLSDARFK